MRMMAPAISAAAVILAVVLVSTFRPNTELPLASGGAPEPGSQAAVVEDSAARVADKELQAAPTPSPAETPVAGTRAASAPSAARSPLPGETPATPMANLMTDRQRELPPGMLAGEQEFAAEPVDGAWAPGAEADLLAKFAQMPGLTLIGLQVECRSTMCRLELIQPGGGPAADGSRPFNILLDSVGLEPRWMMAIQGRTGPMRSVAYLWREGFAPEREAEEPRDTN